MTDGRGPDVIVEAIGLAQTFRAAVEEVAFTGRVVYIGYAKKPVAYETKLFVQKELDILGSRNALPDDFREVIRMLERGNFPVEEAVSIIAPLATLRVCWESGVILQKNHGNYGQSRRGHIDANGNYLRSKSINSRCALTHSDVAIFAW